MTNIERKPTDEFFYNSANDFCHGLNKEKK